MEPSKRTRLDWVGQDRNEEEEEEEEGTMMIEEE